MHLAHQHKDMRCFKRGTGPLVSVLVWLDATEQQAEAIASLHHNCTTNEGVEYVVGSGAWRDVIQQISGDWLLNFSCTARMRTRGWDQILLETNVASTTWHGVSDICCLAASPTGREYDFVFLRRAAAQILGYFPHPIHIVNVMASIDSLFLVPIHIEDLGEASQLISMGGDGEDAHRLLAAIAGATAGYGHPNRVKMWSQPELCYVPETVIKVD